MFLYIPNIFAHCDFTCLYKFTLIYLWGICTPHTSLHSSWFAPYRFTRYFADSPVRASKLSSCPPACCCPLRAGSFSWRLSRLSCFYATDPVAVTNVMLSIRSLYLCTEGGHLSRMWFVTKAAQQILRWWSWQFEVVCIKACDMDDSFFFFWLRVREVRKCMCSSNSHTCTANL